MAEAVQEVLKLRPVIRSPTTLQYHQPRTIPHTAHFYTPKFRLPREQRAHTIDQPWLKQPDPLMPPYPYGKDNRFREANQGLYGGAAITSGNKISKGRNKGKTLRKWFPNVRFETIRSEALDTELKLPITARVMRTIRKCGGLDQYLTGNAPARIKELGTMGWHLRWHVLKSPAYRQKFDEAREKLGTTNPSPLGDTFEAAWSDPVRRKELLDKVQEKWDSLLVRNETFKKVAKQHWDVDVEKLALLESQSVADLALDELTLEEEKLEHGPSRIVDKLVARAANRRRRIEKESVGMLDSQRAGDETMRAEM